MNNNRRHDRQPVDVSVPLTLQESGRSLGRLENFSRGGMCVRLSGNETDGIIASEWAGVFSKDELIRRLDSMIGFSLQLEIVIQENPLGSLHATLSRVEQDAEGILLGFQFESLREPLLNKLSKLVEENK